MRLTETERAATRSTSIDVRAREVIVRQRGAETAFRPGVQIAARYRVKRFIARGGMGEVYEAEDLVLGDTVALKAIRPGRVSDHAIARFRTEVQLARRVTHPNVCRIFDVGEHEGTAFLTMELLDGVNLSERLDARGRLGVDEAAPIVEQILAGLGAAHEVGIVHRDLKSHNVMLVRAPRGGERAVITDFGLALHEDDGREAREIAGSPAYMAPEQIVGGRISPATDVYALGVVVYEIVTGKLPFVGESALATAEQRLDQPAPSARALVPDLAARWEAAIARCLERRPEDRFADAAAARAGFFAAPPVRPTRRTWRVAAALAIAVAAVGIGVLASRPPPRAPVTAPAEARPEIDAELAATLAIVVRRGTRRVDAERAFVARDAFAVLGSGDELEYVRRTVPLSPATQGEQRGLALGAIAPDSLAARVGLEPGDLLTAVAGVPVVADGAYRAILVRLMRDDHADVAYVRDGRSRTLSLSIVEGGVAPAQSVATLRELARQDIRVVDEGHALVTERFWQSVLAQPEWYAASVTPTAWPRGGSGPQQGIVFQAVDEGGAARGLGFRQWDVITNVAGVALTSERALAEELAPRLAGLRQLDIAYLRDGAPRVLRIDVVAALP